MNDAGNFILAHRSTEVLGQNPKYPPLTIAGRTLCYGDKNKTIRIEIWRKTLRNEDELVGSSLTTVNKMASRKEDDMTLKTTEDEV